MISHDRQRPRLPASPGARRLLVAGGVVLLVCIAAAALLRERGSSWGAATAAVVVVLLLGALGAAVFVRRRDRDEPPSSLYTTTASVLREGSTVHRRVRWALYGVLLALGANAALQTWQAHRTESSRLAENTAIELAAVQRMLSQRIGRLAVAAAAAVTHDPREELRAAVERSDGEANRLAVLLADERMLPHAQTDEVREAWQHWLSQRGGLMVAARGLLEAFDDPPGEVTAHVADVHARSDQALNAVQALLQALHAAARERHAAAVSQTRVWAAFNVVLLTVLALVAVEPAVRSVKRQYRRLAVQTTEMQRLALVAERTTNVVMIADQRHRIVWVNQAFTRITGFAPHEAIGHTPLAILACEDVDPRGAERLQASLAQGCGLRAQVLNRAKDGRELWLDLDVRPLFDDAGALEGYVDVAADITELRHAQADLRVAAIAFDSLDGIAITDADQAIVRVNPAFTRITGYSADEAIGQRTGRLLRSGRHGPDFYEAMWEVLERERHWKGEIWNRRKNGEVYPQWLSITAVCDDDGRTTNYVAVFTDITEKKKADETIHSLAYYDPLTGLPNRRLLRERVEQAIAASARSARFAAVLFIDLDQFKELNDSRGHDIGDLLLVEVASRLSACVRASDTVARQGGDEFVIVVSELSTDAAQAVSQAESIAESIRRELGRPFELAGQPHRTTPSIGINVFVGHEHGVDELLKRADIAMYQAKRSGRNALRFFDPKMHAALEERIALEADLRQALSQQQLLLHYQPQVDHTGRVFGAEVLLRWQHPQRGLVPPGQFIALAEESELILEIGHWVLECAAHRLASWSQQSRWPALEVAVNVSARQFRKPEFVETIRAVIARSGIGAGRLKVELTESLVLQDIDDTVVKMKALRESGVKFSLDDFGTGQSSLAYLTRLPLDQLKIDQSFVHNITRSHADAVVVQTIVGMAASLGIEIIAEGVETEEQRRILESLGCLRHQGYLFGRPLPAADFERIVQQQVDIAAVADPRTRPQGAMAQGLDPA